MHCNDQAVLIFKIKLSEYISQKKIANAVNSTGVMHTPKKKEREKKKSWTRVSCDTYDLTLWQQSLPISVTVELCKTLVLISITSVVINKMNVDVSPLPPSKIQHPSYILGVSANNW